MRIVLAVFLGLFFHVNEHLAETKPTQSFKVVLIAGPNDHCRHTSGCHKYIQDMQIIQNCLQQQNENFRVDVELYISLRPMIGDLDSVDAVIIHSGGDSDEDEWHSLFPNASSSNSYRDSAYAEWLAYFDQQMERGMGLVVLHYATAVDHPESVKRYMKWIGGYFNEQSSQVDGNLSAPGTTAIETVAFASPDHEIMNGIKPWTSEEEYYYNMDFGKEISNIIPLLTSELPVDNPKKEIIAWGLERKSGGRGLGFTGCHNHLNMYKDDFRKFLLNSILWAAGAKIPKNGVSSTITRRYLK